MHTIKVRLYRNRKYYISSRMNGRGHPSGPPLPTGVWINLEELRELVRAGYSIQVSCAVTKNDITIAVLKKIIAQNERKASFPWTASQLESVIRTRTGTLAEWRA